MQLRRVGLSAVVALIAVACGGEGDGGDSDGVAAPVATPSSATTATSVAAAPAPGAAVEVPDAVLTDVAAGQEVSLRSMVPSERPVLFWFWAPH